MAFENYMPRQGIEYMKFLANMPLGDFLAAAASDAPVPGGGGVAALAGALGSAMAAMAANFTVGKAKFAQHDALMRSTINQLEVLIEELRNAIDGDAEAFTGISEAYKLPKDGDEAKTKRQKAIADALTASMRVPLQVVRNCRKAAELLPALAAAGNPNLLSDVEVAAIMLDAGARAARVNVLVNSASLTSDEARRAEREADEAVRDIAALAAETAATIRGRNGA